MATNIEIKAKVNDMKLLKETVEKLSDTPSILLTQEDTFFHTPHGRLKLRRLAPDHGQLIYYVRADTYGPKRSDYSIAASSEPDKLKEVLAAAWGICGVVRKQRLLYKVGNTRIHLDEVEGLGRFVELEVVLAAEESAEKGQAIATELMAKLGIAENDLVDTAYIDLLQHRARHPNTITGLQD